MHSRVKPMMYYAISDSPGDVTCAAHPSVTKKRGILHPRFWFLRLGGAGANGCLCCAVALEVGRCCWPGPWALLFTADPFWTAGQ